MSRFLLSCGTSSARRPFRDEIADCLATAQPAGYHYWALQGISTRGLARWIDLDAIAEAAARAGLAGCTEVYGPAILPWSVEEAIWSTGYVKLIYEAAARLQSPLVVITGRPRVEGTHEALIAGLRALLEDVREYPARLALEPHYGSQIETHEDYDRILGEVGDPRVGVTIDTGHFHSAGVDFLRLICAYPERIYNVHVKDHVGTQSVPLGQGEVDLRGLVRTLHEIDYCGPLTVELEVADPENLPRYCAEAYRYLYELVAEVTGQAPA